MFQSTTYINWDLESTAADRDNYYKPQAY